jgi:hypothetical protein
MHIIRARHNDSSKKAGLRKFYAASKYIYLKAPELMNELLILSNFWLNVNTGKEPSCDDGYTVSLDARKYFCCLAWRPNEYLKYPVSVFFEK